MATQFTAACACGAVRYTCNAAALAMYNCHCRACQHASGSGFSPIVVVPAEALTVSGRLTYHALPASNGNHGICGFCGECGAALLAKSESNPDIVVLRAGALDDASSFKPVADIFTVTAQPWTVMDPHIPKVYKSPPVFEPEDTVRM